METDLAGKVILITGATDGIGKAAATEFAKRGAHLTIVGRNKEKTTDVLQKLALVTDNPHLECLICDLSRMADVRRSLIWLATLHEAAALKGEYVSKRRPVAPQKQALDQRLATDLWALSERLWARADTNAARA